MRDSTNVPGEISPSTCVHTHVHILMHTHAHIFTCMHLHTHTHTQTHTHTCIHPHTLHHKHIFTHAQILILFCPYVEISFGHLTLANVKYPYQLCEHKYVNNVSMRSNSHNYPSFSPHFPNVTRFPNISNVALFPKHSRCIPKGTHHHLSSTPACLCELQQPLCATRVCTRNPQQSV